MKIRNLIEIEQDYLIICDNENCDYKIENSSKDPNQNIDDFLNQPCPECWENLLTQKDLDNHKKILKIVSFINKWFSWITIFIPSEKYKKASVHINEKPKNKIKD